jgi:ankyrin repeat protein
MDYLKCCMLSICMVLFSTAVHSEGIKKTEPLYDDQVISEAITLQPETYVAKEDGLLGTGLFSVGTYRHVSLFPVPFDNAVGTNDMGDALTIISFHEGKMKYKRYFKGAVHDVCCGGNYLPSAVPGLTGFGQGGRFVLYDLKRKIARNFSPHRYVERVAVADADKLHFIFSDNHKIDLYDLSGSEAKLIKEIADPLGTVWSAGNDRIFMWEYDEKKLQVLDMNLEPAHHPLEEVIARHKDQIGFMRIVLHPHLPFGILYNGIGGVFVVGWDKGRNTQPRVLIYDGEDFTFSPDGNWVVYKTDHIGQSSQTYMMPVSERYPNYFGSPILLSSDYYNHYAWTTNPTAFVGSGIDTFERWDLENRDYPGKEQISFHEYLVGKDLVHLAVKAAEGTPADKTRRLVASQADLNAKDSKGHTALMRAAMYGHTEAARLLLEAGANVKVKDGYGDTAFCYAAGAGHIEVVKLLLPTKPDINRALKDAATGGHSDIVRFLNAAGADVNSPSAFEPALSRAIIWGHVETVRQLIAAQANVNARYGYSKTDTPLWEAIRVDQPDIVKLLIDARVDVNEHYDDGKTALMYAIEEEHMEIVRLLLAAGANVNTGDSHGATALIYAVSDKDNTEMVEMLLDAKADITKKDRHGNNAALQAAQYGEFGRRNKKIIDLLEQAGAK